MGSRRLGGRGLAVALLPAGILGALLSAHPLSARSLSARSLSAGPAAGAATRPAAAARGTGRPAVAGAVTRPMPGMGLRATLHGSRFYPRAGGSVAYQRGAYGRQLEVRMWHTGPLAGQRLVIYLHGSRAGMMTVARRGTGYLRHRSGVPPCFSGQQIRVRTPRGTLVASGTFRPGPRR